MKSPNIHILPTSTQSRTIFAHFSMGAAFRWRSHKRMAEEATCNGGCLLYCRWGCRRGRNLTKKCSNVDRLCVAVCIRMRGKLCGTRSFPELSFCRLSEGLMVAISFPYGWRRFSPSSFSVAVAVHCCSPLFCTRSASLLAFTNSPGIRAVKGENPNGIANWLNVFYVVVSCCMRRAYKLAQTTSFVVLSCRFVDRFFRRHFFSASSGAFGCSITVMVVVCGGGVECREFFDLPGHIWRAAPFFGSKIFDAEGLGQSLCVFDPWALIGSLQLSM